VHLPFIEHLATGIFALAVLHTFLIKVFEHIAFRFPAGSVQRDFFLLIGEVEIVFGLWAGILMIVLTLSAGSATALQYLDGLDFTEPAFVFAIMTVSATRPILDFAQNLIGTMSRVLPIPREVGFYITALVIGPLLGSLITEPAAMTVTALILRDRFFKRHPSNAFMYATLAVLFVNISIGGVLTPFAAPPILMVAKAWNWDLQHMLSQFGWKAVIATVINASGATLLFFRELQKFDRVSHQLALRPEAAAAKPATPYWIRGVHLFFLALIVLTSHFPAAFVGYFLFFLGFTGITKEYQDELKLRESLLVGFFLAGLVVLGGFQSWWLAPLIRKLDAGTLFVGTTFLTAFTDNAALTYLGSKIPEVTETFKYALVAGAVAGGGLTVIANATNPAGFSILRDSFGAEGINPVKLFAWAILPTLIAMACFWGLA